MAIDPTIQLIEDYLDGSADESQLRQLKDWLEATPANLDVFAQQVFLHQQLRSYLVAEATACSATESNFPVGSGELAPNILSDLTSPPSALIRDVGVFGIDNNSDHNSGGSIGGFWPKNSLMILMVLVIVLLAGGVCYQWGRNSVMLGRGADQAARSDQTAQGNHGGDERRLAADQANVGAVGADQAPYVARLVKLTNCAWDTTRTTAVLSSGAQLRPGQSLHLIEGIAELNSVFPSGVVESFQLEGPVGLMMGSQGVPSLLYGKMSAKVKRQNDVFSLDTPLGRVGVVADASIGVSANANEVELHVFSGSAIFDVLPLFRGANGSRRLNVFTGGSVRLTSTSDGTISFEQGEANEEAFVTPASMSASQLNISNNYVAAIKKAAPIAYWRFDRVERGVVPNVMGDQFAFRVAGSVRWKTYPAGNRSAEFGSMAQAGVLITDDAIDNSLAHGFTVEFWVKPDYVESGTIFSLDQIAANDEMPLQGMMLELTGPAADAFAVQQSRLRFLHRNPPGRDVRTGTSCFSGNPYAPRKWQHVAAVKDGSSMQLFVDGKVEAKGVDSAETADDLRVLIGQLYMFTTGPNASVRPFVGELAEVAIYDRPLSAEEISEHIKLAHDEARPKNSY